MVACKIPLLHESHTGEIWGCLKIHVTIVTIVTIVNIVTIVTIVTIINVPGGS